MSIFNEKTAIFIQKWPIMNQLLLIEQFFDLSGLNLNFGINCLLKNFREIRIRNLEISGSQIFVKFWWPVLIEKGTGFHRFKRSCYLPCLTNNSRFLMNADVFKISGSKIWNFENFSENLEISAVVWTRKDSRRTLWNETSNFGNRRII